MPELCRGVTATAGPGRPPSRFAELGIAGCDGAGAAGQGPDKSGAVAMVDSEGDGRVARGGDCNRGCLGNSRGAAGATVCRCGARSSPGGDGASAAALAYGSGGD